MAFPIPPNYNLLNNAQNFVYDNSVWFEIGAVAQFCGVGIADIEQYYGNRICAKNGILYVDSRHIIDIADRDHDGVNYGIPPALSSMRSMTG